MILKMRIIIHKIKLYYLIEHDADYDKILKESIKLDKIMISLFTRQTQNRIFTQKLPKYVNIEIEKGLK